MAPGGQPRVFVNHVEVPLANLEGLVVEPGQHVVEAKTPGGSTIQRELTLGAGRTEELSLAQPDHREDAASTLPSPAPLDPARDEAASGPKPLAPATPRSAPGALLPVAGVSLGVSGAAFVAGAITGSLSLHAADEVASRCSASGHCPASEQASAASAGRLADASTAAFVGGGVALATGVALLLLRARSPGARVAPSAGMVHADVGLGRASVAGTF